MVRLAQDKDFEFVKTSWKVCFSDSDKFIDWNFEKNYSKDNTLISEYNNIPASVVQYMQYRLTVFNKSIPIRFISGVSTLPEFRNKGLVRKMLSFGLKMIYEKGAAFCTLVPAVFGMYEKFGYVTVHQRPSYINADVSGVRVEAAYDGLIETLDKIYREHHKKTAIYIDRCRHDWELILDDLFNISEGCILLDNADNPTAYAIIHKDNNELCEVCGDLKFEFKEKKDAPLMARVINAKAALDACTEVLCENSVFNIKDDFIEQNNKAYKIVNKKAVEVEAVGERMDISELSAYLFEKMRKNGGIGINYVMEI